MEKKSKFSETTCRLAGQATASSGHTSSATAALRASRKRCFRICLSAVPQATMTGCSISATRLRAACSLCRQRRFLTTSAEKRRTQRLLPRPRSRTSRRPRRRMIHHSRLDHLKERRMNNLHRELAPISDTAWSQIEEETTRTLKRYLAGRRVVDFPSPGGLALPGVATGHLLPINA